MIQEYKKRYYNTMTKPWLLQYYGIQNTRIGYGRALNIQFHLVGWFASKSEKEFLWQLMSYPCGQFSTLSKKNIWASGLGSQLPHPPLNFIFKKN